MNEWDNTQYQKMVSNINICLDVVRIKVERREDPYLIEKIVKGIDTLILKCYNLNPGEQKQNELIKMHDQNLLVLGLLELVKSHGWEMIKFE